MPSSSLTIPLGSSYPLGVFQAGGLTSTTVKVSAGDTIYYKSTPLVSSASNDGNITNGNSQTFTNPTWLISASSSSLLVTDYQGGGDIEQVFQTWVPIRSQQQVPLAGATSAGQLLCTGTLNTFVAVAGVATGQAMFYLDPATFPLASGRTPKVRIVGNVTSNAVAPACTNLVYALYPVATTGGASGAVPTVATLGTVVTSVTITSPNATTQAVAAGPAVSFPAAGWYCFALTVGTGGTAANANTIHGFELQVERTAP